MFFFLLYKIISDKILHIKPVMTHHGLGYVHVLTDTGFIDPYKYFWNIALAQQ